MSRYSDRARRNTRNGIDMRIAIIKARMNELLKEIATYNRYLGRGLNDRWIKHVMTTIAKKWTKIIFFEKFHSFLSHLGKRGVFGGHFSPEYEV